MFVGRNNTTLVTAQLLYSTNLRKRTGDRNEDGMKMCHSSWLPRDKMLECPGTSVGKGHVRGGVCMMF